MTPDKILKALMSSRKTGRVVGIQLKKKARPILTAVDDVNSLIVKVRESTCYGQTIPNRNILLEEIEMVRCFNSYFEDPVFVRLRNLKNSIRKIRSAVH